MAFELIEFQEGDAITVMSYGTVKLSRNFRAYAKDLMDGNDAIQIFKDEEDKIAFLFVKSGTLNSVPVNKKLHEFSTKRLLGKLLCLREAAVFEPYIKEEDGKKLLVIDLKKGTKHIKKERRQNK